LIDLARSYPSIYGARISGGGSGGTVAVISERGADSELQELIERYSNKTHHRPQIFSGSSSGAAFSPVIRLS
jgi:galactokinase